ncbi:hypothetical protein [Streptomyces sp. NBC_01618]|nr:hypothetical protein OH735_15460 [Streptomyces sp. NBC_01618]
MTTARVRSRRGKLLTAGTGGPMAVKAYQLLRAPMNTPAAPGHRSGGAG